MEPIKVVVVGDGAVGKTCLLLSFSQNRFPSSYVPTIFDTISTGINVENKEYTLDLWDTAGQDDYERLRPLSYPNTNVFIVCFSLVSPTSYENVLTKWKSEIFEFCPNAKIVLCGTKSDLRDEFDSIPNDQKDPTWKPISTDKGMKAASKIGAFKYLECSAFKAKGIKEVFEAAVLSTLATEKKKCRI